MNEPRRLRDAEGPAATLLGGAELDVPHASRKRALAFTGAAASMLASSGAMAATGTALFKGVMVWVLVGTVGGGLMSLTVAETVSHFDARSAARRSAVPPLPLPPPRERSAVTKAEPTAPETATPEAVAPEAATPEAATFAADPALKAPARAVSVAKAAPSAPQPAAVSNLFDEQRSIEAARAAVARGNAAAALATLNDYQRAYPQGQFGPEALALRVEALRAQGNVEQAQSFARQFERRYPHHPLLSRVQASARR